MNNVKITKGNEIFVNETFKTAEKNKKIGLYFSHIGESYAPTDGQDSIRGKGGILEVGDALKQGLEKNGVEVIIDKTPHEPHDANCYIRSRRTALKLLKQGTDAIVDIHRDAVPKSHYLDEVNGEPVAKVRLVLGRRNQNIKANEALAYKVKAVGKKMYPGFIRDIY